MAFIEHALGKTTTPFEVLVPKSHPLFGYMAALGDSQPKSRLFDLAEGRQVYAYTQMGSGKSGDLPKRRRTVATFVKELHTLIATWGSTGFISWAALGEQPLRWNMACGIQVLVYKA